MLCHVESHPKQQLFIQVITVGACSSQSCDSQHLQQHINNVRHYLYVTLRMNRALEVDAQDQWGDFWLKAVIVEESVGDCETSSATYRLPVPPSSLLFMSWLTPTYGKHASSNHSLVSSITSLNVAKLRLKCFDFQQSFWRFKWLATVLTYICVIWIDQFYDSVLFGSLSSPSPSHYRGRFHCDSSSSFIVNISSSLQWV